MIDYYRDSNINSNYNGSIQNKQIYKSRDTLNKD